MSSGRKTVSGNLPAELAERQSDQSLEARDYAAGTERVERIGRRAAQYLNPKSAAHEELYDYGHVLIELVLELRSTRESDARIGREVRAWVEEKAAHFAARDESRGEA